VPIFTDVNTGNTVTSPIKDITIARSVVSVPNGQTIVMGGMITKTDNTSERKVPCLGDLPLIGRAFRFDSKTTRRTELLIFLTPRIIKNDEDNEVIKQVEAERIHFLEEEAEAIHGPLFGVSPGDAAGTLNQQNMHHGAASAIPPVPNETNDADEADVPTTLMPGGAFQLNEPRFLDAGTSNVSDEDDESTTAESRSTGAETPPARPKSAAGGKPHRLNRVVSSSSN
jgi:hypothetical protein